MAVTTYTEVLTFVDSMTSVFISANVQAVAQAITPALTTLLGVYVMLWGFLLMRGQIQEPMMDGLMRIGRMVLVLYLALGLANYQLYIVETFNVAPYQLGAAFFGGSGNETMVSSLDQMLESGFVAGKKFWDQGGILVGDFGMYMVALLCWGQTIAVTAYACFLIVLSKIALAVVLAIGPLFIVSLLFSTTGDFFSRWIQQLCNFALIIILVIAVNALILTLFERAATGAAAITSTAQISKIFPFLVTGAISLLVLAQIPSIAAGLAGGVSANSYGMGRMVAGLMRKGLRSMLPARRNRQRDPSQERLRKRGGRISRGRI